MELSKQLYREIEELQVKELFRAYNPDHMERKHILVTDGDLLQRLCRIKIEKDEIILCTKFSEPLDEVLNLIHDCILKNTRDIEKWNPLKTDLVLHMPLSRIFYVCNFKNQKVRKIINLLDKNSFFQNWK